MKTFIKTATLSLLTTASLSLNFGSQAQSFMGDSINFLHRQTVNYSPTAQLQHIELRTLSLVDQDANKGCNLNIYDTRFHCNLIDF